MDILVIPSKMGHDFEYILDDTKLKVVDSSRIRPVGTINNFDSLRPSGKVKKQKGKRLRKKIVQY